MLGWLSLAFSLALSGSFWLSLALSGSLWRSGALWLSLALSGPALLDACQCVIDLPVRYQYVIQCVISALSSALFRVSIQSPISGVGVVKKQILK